MVAKTRALSRPPSLTRWLLIGSMFTMGACGLVYEYVLSTLATYLLGSSIDQFSMIIGLMMFMMGAAAGLQSWVKRDLLDAFLWVEIGLGLIGGLSALLVYLSFGVTEHFRLVLYAFVSLVGFAIGLEIPLLVRINRHYAASLRTNLSQILSMDYVGALIGALVWTYFLRRTFGIVQVGFVLGLLNLAIALLALVYFWPLLRRPRRLGATVAVAAATLGFAALRAPDWTAAAEQRLFRDPVIYSATSDYQQITITERGDRLRFYINGHLQFSSRDEHIYHELLVHPALTMRGAPRRVLVLGGGDGLAVREILRHPTVRRVDLVDLDPRMIELARSQSSLVALNRGSLSDARVHASVAAFVSGQGETLVRQESERPVGRVRGEEGTLASVQVVTVDAGRFLDELDGDPYDVVIIDFPDPSTVELAKLYSREFYRTLMRHLARGGLVAIQSGSPFNAREAYLCVGRTLRAAGYEAVPYHDHVPSFGEWGFWIARKDGDGYDAPLATACDRITEIPVETRYLTAPVWKAATVFGQGWLESKQETINSLLDPILTDLHRQGWEEE